MWVVGPWRAYASTPGARLRHVCCGSETSAIPAAETVGPQGFVLGVDLRRRCLTLGRAKARIRDLKQFEFRVGDMLDLQLTAIGFDTVICVFESSSSGIWGLCASFGGARFVPGGRLPVHVGSSFFRPAAIYLECGPRTGSILGTGFHRLKRYASSSYRRIPDIAAEMTSHALGSPEDWWPMVLGTRYSRTIERGCRDA